MLDLDKNYVNSRYRYAIEKVTLTAYPLRADIVVVRKPKALRPGVYPCARGTDQAFRLERLYRELFPLSNVQVPQLEDLLQIDNLGDIATIIEIKNCPIDECAIGQVLTYEALLRLDYNVGQAEKVIAAPRDYILQTNPVLITVARLLGERALVR